MINFIKDYFYIIVIVIIAIGISLPYWKAIKLSKARKKKQPIPRPVLFVAVIGVIAGIILGIFVLKYAVNGWDEIFPPMISTLFLAGSILGLLVALKAGYFRKEMQPQGILEQANPEALALPVKSSWALIALAFVWGTICGILVSMVLITIA